MQIEEERMSFLIRNEENSLFRLGRFHFVILNDEFFLEYFDGIQLLGRFGLSKHDFTEIALSEDSQEVKMI